MTSAPIRDPLADHLLTPEDAAFLFIDYQPAQLATVRSMDPALLVKNAVSTVRTIKSFGVPVVHSTVNVASGQGQPTLPELAGLLAEDKPLDRTTVNSWEDLASSSSAPCALARLRAAARLGPPGHRLGDRRDRPHRPSLEGAIAPRSSGDALPTTPSGRQ
jgi:nicotinamidase-related amidase